MSTMDAYKIDLLKSQLEGQAFKYEIGDDFFAEMDGIIQCGNIHSTMKCLSVGTIFKFQIHSVGTVVVPCDRCLSDLKLQIDTTNLLNVKLGDEYVDDGDYVVVSEADGCLDLAQFIYEFIVLSMPIVCCHESGECDEAMMQELSKHQSVSGDVKNGDKEENENNESVGLADSRWEVLKQLKNKQ